MTVKEALGTLNQGLNVASQKGSFGLKDAATLQQALEIVAQFVVNHSVSEEVEDEAPGKLKKAKA